MSFKYLNTVMLSFLLWMVTDLEASNISAVGSGVSCVADLGFGSSFTSEDNVSLETHDDEQQEYWSKLSIFLHIFLPVAGLAFILKQKHIFSRLLLQLDRNCVSVFCPSFSRRERLLNWAGSILPDTWSSRSKTLSGGVVELWSDGSLLCTLINSVIPGACPNPHRHWKKPPLHAQAIAYKYLGVIPIFTENDFSGELTVRLERNFLHYLNELQQAILKLSERNEVGKCVSMQYIARGMGLYTGEQHRKTVFYVYLNKTNAGPHSNVIIQIRGPYGTYGKAVIPKFHNDLFTTPEINVISEKMTTKLLQESSKPNSLFTRNFSLPFMQYHKKHMGDNIVIDVTMEDNRAKVTYIPKNYGMYEIIMISNGELVMGCPFNVHILNNTTGIEENFEQEEKQDEFPNMKRRKVISKTIDFVDEQMSLADLLRRYKFKEDVKREETLNEVEEGGDDAKSVEASTSGIAEGSLVEEDVKDEEEIKEAEVDDSRKEISQIVFNIENIPEEDQFNVLEKQNSESVNENASSKLQEAIAIKEDLHVLEIAQQTGNYISKANVTCTDKSKVVNNDVPLNTNVKANKNSNYLSLVDNKKIFDAENTGDNEVIDCNTVIYEYPRLRLVNKIQIPEKFCVRQNLPINNFVPDLDTKYFKNVINSSNKRDVPKSTLQQDYMKDVTNKIENDSLIPEKSLEDENCNDANSSIDSLEHNEVKLNLVHALSRRNSKSDLEKLKAVPRRFFQSPEPPKENIKRTSPSLDNQRNTSPICPDHIAPEVDNEFRKISVAERRKIFARQTPQNTSCSTNSSFSDTENGEGSRPPKHFRQFDGLSVLNYLGSLKESDASRNPEKYSLCSTVSLPDISSVQSDYVFQNSVKQRKTFWEKISSSSSSLSTNTDCSPKRTKVLTEAERCRLIWKRPSEATVSNTDIRAVGETPEKERRSDFCKSADDIISISCIPYESSKEYKSLDKSLDRCTMVSIDERKKMLLRQNYEEEKVYSLKKNSIKRSYGKNMNQIVEERTEDKTGDTTVFSPILDKIKIYDNACTLTNNAKEEKTRESSATKDISKNYIHNDLQQSLPHTEKVTVKSHFKRAIKYFKNLEEKSLGKSKFSPRKDSRRFSLDIQTNKNKTNKKGGSLNLPNVTDRFMVNNLYDDVFGGRRGSFRGAANRNALVEALATFSRKENNNNDDEDDIKYDMFKKRGKNRKRRSVRSIFDLYY